VRGALLVPHEHVADRGAGQRVVRRHDGAAWVPEHDLDALALEDGDVITIDLKARTLHVDISNEELAARRAHWNAAPPRFARGVMAKYARLVSSAAEGAITGAL
jgi:hypothetical protein